MLSDEMAGTLLFININNCLFSKFIMEKLKRPLDTTTEFWSTQAISIMCFDEGWRYNCQQETETVFYITIQMGMTPDRRIEQNGTKRSKKGW